MPRVQFVRTRLQARSIIVKNTRRQIITLLGLLPFAGGYLFSSASLAEHALGNDYILVNGWILKKSDLTDYLR